MGYKKRVPDRWKDYKPCTWTPIEGQKIISFKTPLSKTFETENDGDEGLIHTERFTPSDLINELEKKKLRLGMVLDFTFTKRYYNPKELTDQGIIYKKMMCPGHEIPKEQDVERFECEVLTFLDNDDTGALVGVHCTHGLNRTGYMVCRYLIDCKGYQPEDAIKAFNDARGYPIERENYLEELRSRTPGYKVEFPDYSESEINTQDRDSRKRREFMPGEKRGRDVEFSGQTNKRKRTLSGGNYGVDADEEHSSTHKHYVPAIHAHERYSDQHQWYPPRNDYDDRRNDYYVRRTYYDDRRRNNYDDKRNDYHDRRNDYHDRQKNYDARRGFESSYWARTNNSDWYQYGTDYYKPSQDGNYRYQNRTFGSKKP